MGAKKTMIFSLAAAVIIAAVVLVALNYPRFNTKKPADIKLADVSLSESGDKQDSSGEKSDETLQQLAISPDNVQNVIAFLDRADSYHRVMKAVSSWNGGSAEYSIEVWTAPEGTKISVVRTGEDEVKNMLLADGMFYVWYGNSREYYSAETGGLLGEPSHLADELQMMITYEDVLKLRKSDIADAGYAVVEGTQYIYVKTVGDELGNRDTYYVSLETGLLEMAETENRGRTVYSLQTVSMDLASPDPELFRLPD